MTLDSLSCSIIDEKYRNIFIIIPTLYFRDSRINLRLSHIINCIVIITNQSIGHHSKETISTEKLCEVIT